MASTYHTVSDEMARTDWSPAAPRPSRASDTEGRPNLVAIAVAVAVSLAAIAGVIYLLPPGSY